MPLQRLDLDGCATGRVLRRLSLRWVLCWLLLGFVFWDLRRSYQCKRKELIFTLTQGTSKNGTCCFLVMSTKIFSHFRGEIKEFRCETRLRSCLVSITNFFECSKKASCRNYSSNAGRKLLLSLPKLACKSLIIHQQSTSKGKLSFFVSRISVRCSATS